MNHLEQWLRFIHTVAQTPAPQEPMPAWGKRAQEVFDSWQNTSDVFPVSTLVIIFLVLAVVMSGVWLRQWYKNRPVDPTPNLLFRQMARQLQLGLLDQWLMIRIAHTQQLPSPLTLLLSRSTFQHHIQLYAQSISPLRAPMMLARGERITQAIYGSELQAQKDTLAALKQANFQPVVPSIDPSHPPDAEASTDVEPVMQTRRQSLAS